MNAGLFYSKCGKNNVGPLKTGFTVNQKVHTADNC